MTGLLLAVTHPDDDALRDKLRDVLSRPDYHIETPQDSSVWWFEWVLQAVRWIIKPFQWLIESTDGMPLALRLLIVVPLFVVAIALIAHIGYTLFRAMRGDRPVALSSDSTRQAARMPAAEWERKADDAARRGDLIEAVRYLWRACLARLEDHEKRSFRRGTTNREHLRRYRQTPLFEPLEVLVVTIERKWYGEEQCQTDDYQACRQAHAQTLASLSGRS